MNPADILKAADEEAAKAPPAERARVRSEYIGTAVADSCFCASCGARGFVTLCDRCSRCE